jgi:hypothetical protein
MHGHSILAPLEPWEMSSGGDLGLEITANHRSRIGKKLFMIGGKQGVQSEKAREVFTIDHHDA